jgi:hypothetical protein
MRRSLFLLYPIPCSSRARVLHWRGASIAHLFTATLSGCAPSHFIETQLASATPEYSSTDRPPVRMLEELLVQHYRSRPALWFLILPETAPFASLRRSNLIAISFLAFFTLGMLLVGFAHTSMRTSLPSSGRAQATATHQLKPGSVPPLAHHVR